MFTGKHLCWSLFLINFFHKLPVSASAISPYSQWRINGGHFRVTLPKKTTHSTWGTFLGFLWKVLKGIQSKWCITIAEKIKFSIKDFCSFLRTWSQLLKKSLMANFIFCARRVLFERSEAQLRFHTSNYNSCNHNSDKDKGQPFSDDD